MLSCALFFVINYAMESGGSTEVLHAQNHENKKSEYEFKPFSSSMTLAAVGDILIHGTVYKDASTGNRYDFKPMFANVKELLLQPDLTIANQETIVGGTEIGLSTYPSFNSPFEVADALQDAGVDIVSIANNHTLDRGEKAIISATGYLDKIGMAYTGGYRSIEDRNVIRILNRNGIKIAFLSYTYGTNGIPVPEGKEYLVNLIDMPQIKKDIAQAKEVSDVIAVSMHWGNEYQRIPSDEQKSLAKELADEGVDIIIGHHPHVLQPMEWVKGKDGHDTFVIYSLGNFLSGQMKNYKDIGGVLQIEIVKEVKSPNDTIIRLQKPVFTPTYVTNQRYHNFKIVPLKKAASVGLTNAQAIDQEINEFMNQWLK
ncbi:CapA family protein [Ferdinandcohnia quinoae]|nr:CapA family protein [Fredinandcohnia sp. SECRCQ15]